MALNTMVGTVIGVCCNPEPGIPKPVVERIHLLEDLGVEGDYHAGKLVRHRYLAKKYPTQPNLRQVLIVDGAVYRELVEQGIYLGPGSMGENVTVEDLPVMALVEGARLVLGNALLEVTEVRVPCKQLNGMHAGLLKLMAVKKGGQITYKAGMMTRVLKEGWVSAGDKIQLAIQTPNELRSETMPLGNDALASS